MKPFHASNQTELNLPQRQERPWDLKMRNSIVSADQSRPLKHHLRKTLEANTWQWPKRPIIFLTDPHADPEAFLHSLVASGGIHPTPTDRPTIRLTPLGQKALFLIGGDCLEKGPSNLGLLRLIRQLIEQGARVKILAGNHDIRILLGMRVVGNTSDPRSGHLFVRLGNKIIPFLAELLAYYQQNRKRFSKKFHKEIKAIGDDNQCRTQLYPAKNWQQRFLAASADLMTEKAAKNELSRFRSRRHRFERARKAHGLGTRDLYIATRIWQQLFVHKEGEFHWYLKRLKMAHRSGSLLFLHAGLNDYAIETIHHKGDEGLNRIFRKTLNRHPLDLYFGPLGGILRTKYRPYEWALTDQGSSQLRRSGITAIVHGHRNLHNGQRIVLRKGLIHIECDCSMDCQTRKRENLEGHGVSATVIDPNGTIRGISNDSDYIKVFKPKQLLQQLQQRQREQRR